MKTSYIYKISTVILLLALTFNSTSFAQQKNLTEKEAKAWVESKQWGKNLPINVYADVNSIEFAKQYNANKEEWDKAFAFIKEKNLKALAVDKYLIDGDNVYATITNAPDKDYDKTGWESHRKYIDLQYIVSGAEKIEVAPLETATVTKPYDETKDVANYTAKGKLYTATPKEFFLFFPNEAHRPSIKVAGYDTVKKLVIKIRYVK